MTEAELYRELKSRYPTAPLRVRNGTLLFGMAGGQPVHDRALGAIDPRALAETPMSEIARLGALVEEKIRECGGAA